MNICYHVLTSSTQLQEQVISRRVKNENVCEMSKNEKCTCKGCKTIVKYANLSRSCCHRLHGCLSSQMSQLMCTYGEDKGLLYCNIFSKS